MQPFILARPHLADHPEKQLGLLLEARCFGLRKNAAQFGEVDEFVDAGLVIGELRLPTFGTHLLGALMDLQGKIDEGRCYNDDTGDLCNEGNLFEGHGSISSNGAVGPALISPSTSSRKPGGK